MSVGSLGWDDDQTKSWQKEVKKIRHTNYTVEEEEEEEEQVNEK